ncbi:MAG UNVERIFIED_CONTAM: hypothetical protein LVR18_37495 [Planctomycetaceae bacterium]|jgi:hypothetical protein
MKHDKPCEDIAESRTRAASTYQLHTLPQQITTLVNHPHREDIRRSLPATSGTVILETAQKRVEVPASRQMPRPPVRMTRRPCRRQAAA